MQKLRPSKEPISRNRDEKEADSRNESTKKKRILL